MGQFKKTAQQVSLFENKQISLPTKEQKTEYPLKPDFDPYKNLSAKDTVIKLLNESIADVMKRKGENQKYDFQNLTSNDRTKNFSPEDNFIMENILKNKNKNIKKA